MSQHSLHSGSPQIERVSAIASASPCAAYVHIPFCRRRCYYCDFPVSVLGDRLRGETSGTVAQYLDVLCQEILTTPRLGGSLQTVFFGGGTPSLLSAGQIQRILDRLDQQFGIDATAEISIEMDPGTFDQSQVEGYAAAGVNRVSLGVQAFQDGLLRLCGRSHTVADIAIAVELLHGAGIVNFSLDLISGLPHQTLDQWQESLEQAILLQPNHLSTYDLTLESPTPFGRQYQPGSAPLPSDEMTAEMYRLAQHTLTAAGYEHYEISNYAQPGYACRHNRVYWKNEPYYGFGMGAASYTQGQRFSRPRTRQDYYQWVQKYQTAQGQIDCPPTPNREVLLDTLMLGLRLAEGIGLDEIAARFGSGSLRRIGACLKPYAGTGWIDLKLPSTTGWHPLGGSAELIAILNDLSEQTLTQWPDLHLCLTDPEGFLFSNTVLTVFFEEWSDESNP